MDEPYKRFKVRGMKKLPWILIVLLVIACVTAWFRLHEPPAEVRVETKIKTVVKTDTVLISAPIVAFFQITSYSTQSGCSLWQ